MAAGAATDDRGDGVVDARRSGRAGDRGSAAACPEPVAIAATASLAASVDARVYLAALFLTLVSALLFGMIPARQVSQSSPLQAMKSGPVDSTPLRRFTLRDLLLGAQIAICTLLVTASLVAVRGMVRMLHAPLGFQPQGAMLADIDLSEMEQRGDALLEKQKAMLEAVQRIPGVTTAGAVNRVPFTGGLRGVPVFPPGTTDFNLNNSVLAPYVFTMSPGYLEAAGTQAPKLGGMSHGMTPKRRRMSRS